MKLKNLKLTLLMFVAIALGAAATACSGHTEVNELVGTLNEYAQNFDNVNTLEEFNEQMQQFNNATSNYAKSDVKIDQSDRDAILKAIDGFSASVNKSMSKLLGVPVMTDEQRDQQMQILANDVANTQTLGELITICMQE